MAGKNSVFTNNSAPSVDDTWLNLQQNEGNNIITGSGQSLSDAINNQRVIGVSRFAANNFYIDSGSANAYVLTLAASMTNPVSSTVGYFVGMTIRFRAGNANTGASTVNINSAGVKNLKKEDGTTDLVAGDIPTDRDVKFRYNGTSFVLDLNVPDASTTTKGIAKLITNANLAAGTNATDIVTAIAMASLYPDIVIGSQNSISFPIKDGGAFKKFTIKSGITGNLSSGNPGTTITFASAFTGAALGGFVIGTTYSGVAESNNTVPTLTVSNMVVTVGGNSAQPYRWFAFGYDN